MYIKFFDTGQILRYIVVPAGIVLVCLALLRSIAPMPKQVFPTPQQLIRYRLSDNETRNDNEAKENFLFAMDTTTTEAPQVTTTQTVQTRSERLRELMKCRDRVPLRQTQQLGDYWLLQNFVQSEWNSKVNCAETITYTTVADVTFLIHLRWLIPRWQAPISVAVFAPGHDMNVALSTIKYLRTCLPESPLIRDLVNFHIYFPAAHVSEYIPSTEIEALLWEFECGHEYILTNRTLTYRAMNNLTFPINIGRNIARSAAYTQFILASDIELLPSKNLVEKFLNLLLREPDKILNGEIPRVFSLPVFEIVKGISLPQNKTQLLPLLTNKKAVSFHAKLCDPCHRIPKYNEWVNTTSETTEISILTVAKREDAFQHWEPFYISDNKEPFFDERITWEGNSDKRIQGYAMCLLQYEFHVIQNAFLIHPGIKLRNENSGSKNMYDTNNLIATKIKPEYKRLYGNYSHCDV